MGEQLDRAQAWALLTEFNQDPFHLHHARTVEGVMRYFAPVSYTHLLRHPEPLAGGHALASDDRGRDPRDGRCVRQDREAAA